MDLLHSGVSTVSAWSLRTATSPAWRPSSRRKERCLTLRRPENPGEFSPGVPEVRLYRGTVREGEVSTPERSASPGFASRQRGHFHPDQSDSANGDGNGWSAWAVVGNGSRHRLRLRPRTYGFRKLSDLVRKPARSKWISRKAGRCGSGRSLHIVPIPSCTGCGTEAAPEIERRAVALHSSPGSLSVVAFVAARL